MTFWIWGVTVLILFALLAIDYGLLRWIREVIGTGEALAVGAYRQIRRLVVLVIGVSVILVGILLIVLPGPAVIVIPMGLAILGIEFAWARRWLLRARSLLKESWDGVRGRT